MKRGFTLAEVLITLGIIGVVAAMTIPTLVQNYKKKQASVKLKRFYSMMLQAIQLSEVDNGSALYWDKESIARNEDGEIDNTEQKARVERFYTKYLASYLKSVKITSSQFHENRLRFYFQDGSVTDINNGDCIHFIYDINGDSSPNVPGRDQFGFLLCNSQYNSSYHMFYPNRAFGSYKQDEKDVSDREKALQACKEFASYCTFLLEHYDNWEFKEDYPYKL